MVNDRTMRQILWAAAIYMLGGALMFAFPGSPLGKFAAMPADVPLIYRVFTALFILAFAGMYAWLAMQPAMVKPMVWLGAIGKAAAFLAVLALWLAGQATPSVVFIFSGDPVFAALFVWWLLGAGNTNKP